MRSGPVSGRLTRALFAAGALLAAAPAETQHVICCNHLIDAKGSWFGAMRNCGRALEQMGPKQRAVICEELNKLKASCPDVEPYCPLICDQAQIDSIQKRIGGLRSSLPGHEKSINDARLKRIDASNRLWGKGEGLKFEGGSVARFGKAMLDSGLLATGGGGGVGKTYSKVTSYYNEFSGWAGKAWALGSDPADMEKWGELGQKLLEMEADAILKKRSSEAIQAMNQNFKKSGNYVGAQGVYKQRYGNYGRLKDFKEKGGNLASALSTLWELYDKTDKLANDLQDWIEAYKDQERNKKDVEKVSAEIDRLAAQRRKLEEACGQKPKAGLFPGVPYPGYDLLLAHSTPEQGYLLRVADKKAPSAADKEAAARLRAAEQALTRLRAFQRTLKEMDNNVGRQVFAPASPWLARVWREAQPRELLVHLVKEARDGIGRFGKSLEQLASSGEPTLKAVQGIPPDTGQ